ncbi:MAG: histidinol dehydrogenase, partial [Clostridia bacterium]|nr:histidinol dehydrogenase [Clostridia bacterium]
MSVPILKYGKDDMSRVFGRTQLDNSEYISTVNAIIEDVRNRGDKALFDYALKFDRQVIDETSILVSDDEIDDAYKKVDKSLVESIRRAKQSILEYHSRQRDKFSNEFFLAGANKTSTLGWIYRPLARVGLYVPGGKASYPSTVLMTALPAIAAGVGEVIVTTPNINNPAILVACKECGIDKIYKVGGAQAIAAMAYGTK